VVEVHCEVTIGYNPRFAVTERTVEAIWASFDVDDSGTIDSAEFTVLFAMLRSYVGQYAADKQLQVVKHSPGTGHTDLALAEVQEGMNQLSADELHELEDQLSRLSTAVGSRKRQLTHHQVTAQIQAKTDEVLEVVKLETEELQVNIEQMKSDHKLETQELQGSIQQMKNDHTLETQELQGSIQEIKSEHEDMLAERDETIRSLRVR
jgi:hypothetical protein